MEFIWSGILYLRSPLASQPLLVHRAAFMVDLRWLCISQGSYSQRHDTTICVNSFNQDAPNFAPFPRIYHAYLGTILTSQPTVEFPRNFLAWLGARLGEDGGVGKQALSDLVMRSVGDICFFSLFFIEPWWFDQDYC